MGAFERRWDTKGAPETIAMLEKLMENTGCTCTTITGSPLMKFLNLNSNHILLLMTLLQAVTILQDLRDFPGKAVLSFLDERSLQLLRYISGSDRCPFINVRLEDAKDVLEWLIAHPDSCKDIGDAGRRWILDYWNETSLIQHFTKSYSDLLENSEFPGRQKDLLNRDIVSQFFNRELPDIIYSSRAANRFI